jgi:MFS family permease
VVRICGMTRNAKRPAFAFAASLGVLTILAIPAILACTDPRPRRVFVPLEAKHQGGDPLAIAQRVMRDLGFVVLPLDPGSPLLVSEWVHRDGLAGRERYRVMIRVTGAGPTLGFVVAVPVELVHGDRYALHGEDEALRRHVVATLLARMQTGR